MDIIRRLNALANSEHDDVSIGYEAAEMILDLLTHVAALQAKVDALMLEFCPEEMNEEQIENWARHQRPAPGANLQLGGPVNEMLCAGG